MKNSFFHRIKKYVKLFTNFCLVSTVLAISHGKWVSFYSIISKQWLQHFFYLKEGEVTGLYRNGTSISVTATFEKQIVKVIS